MRAAAVLGTQRTWQAEPRTRDQVIDDAPSRRRQRALMAER